MKGLCKRAGVKEFGFHALRRYVASVLADTHKLSSKAIQRVLRHKNVTTTERYIHNLNNDMAAVMELLAEKNPQAEPPKSSDEIKNASN
jgi:integrase